jgi:PAS domain S-box-containing protein
VTVEGRVLESVGDAVVALAADGQVLYWPPAAERLLGYGEAELLGRRLAEAAPGWPPGQLRGERRLALRRADGRPLVVALTATPLPGQARGGDGTVVVVKDLEPWIGPPAEAEEPAEGLDVEERLGATFRGVMEATGADFDPGETLDQLAHRLAVEGRRLLPGAECMVAVVPAERQDTFLCVGGAGPFAERLVGRSYPLEGSIAGRALAEGRPQESIRMDEEGADPALLGAAGIHTLRAVPMISRHALPDGRTALGALTVMRGAAAPFHAEERRLIDSFGALIALSIQRAELRAAADRSVERLQLAIDVALDLAQSLDVRDVVRRLVRRAALGTRADRCVLLRVESEETVVEDAYDVAGYEDLPGYRQPVHAQELMARAVSTRSPVLGGGYDLVGMPTPLQEALADVGHTATVPLLYGGEVVAILVLSRRAGPPFGPEDLEALSLLGAPAALALRNSFLYAQTEEASRVKSDFLDMAAHELRAPLTVIAGYLSMLREDALGPVPPAWVEPLRALELKVDELGRLVEDLLMAARLETGRLTSVIEAVDLRAAAKQVAAARPGVEVAVRRPLHVRADRVHVARILEQLVGNALAYGRREEPAWARIDAQAVPGRGEARLTVEDRGRGIPPDAVSRIFERFQRIEDLEHPPVPGTGLGLYIARELAERYGGRLELEWTEPSRGSGFALYLPLAASATGEEAR